MLKAGSLIFFSTGSYSDYQVLGSFVVLQDLVQADIDPLILETVADTKKYNEESTIAYKKWREGDKTTPLPQWSSPTERFISKMIRSGFLASLTQTEYWLDDHSHGNVAMKIEGD